LEYVKGVANKYRVSEKIKYNTKVVGAIRHDNKGVWIVKTKHDKPSGESEVQEVEAEIVIISVGTLNNWK
jgi:cation diffusion facilitator CzcD-associated flavoprotein CzcO